MTFYTSHDLPITFNTPHDLLITSDMYNDLLVIFNTFINLAVPMQHAFDILTEVLTYILITLLTVHNLCLLLARIISFSSSRKWPHRAVSLHLETPFLYFAKHFKESMHWFLDQCLLPCLKQR